MNRQIVWVGTYTTFDDSRSEGIGAMARRDDGSLAFIGTAVVAPDPSYLLAHPQNPAILFATDEGNSGVQSFRRTGETSLEPLGWVPTAGEYPCHLALRTARDGGQWLDVACYGNGAIAVHPVSADGVIGEVAQQLAGSGSGPHHEQDGPHAHSTLAVAGQVLSADLGSDHVHVHDVRDDGLLERVASIELPPGTGPRDLVTHPSGVVWVLGEHGKTVTVLHRGEHGFTVAESTLLVPRAQADAISADQAAGLSLTRDGLRAYAGLRGSNTISVISVDADGERPRPVGSFSAGGNWPRHHLLDGDIVHVANERGGTVVSMRLDPQTDGATQIGLPEPVAMPTFLLPA